MNPIGPKYDEQLSTGYFKKYFFNKLGNVDSILYVDYGIGVAPTAPFQVDTISDTAIIVYTYPFLESRVINSRYYKIKAGQRILLSTDYF
ncbi:MAG: hypothetical protein NTU43_12030 [Bacteroidetes bacterium]|nr:hypothetical protein [Bacteroidota bacterium]